MNDLTRDANTRKLLRLADVVAGIAAQVCGECYRRRRGEQPSPTTVRKDMLRAAVVEYMAARDADDGITPPDGVYFQQEACTTDAEPTTTSRSHQQEEAPR